MEHKLTKEKSLNVITHGVETARYNSIIKVEHKEKEFALYACGGRVILLDIDSNEVTLD